MNGLLNHLWQSTLFAAGIALLCYVLRHNNPRLRYWLWLAASVKFLLPFSLLVTLGDRLELPPANPPITAAAVETLTTTFAPAIGRTLPIPAAPRWPQTLAVLWALGAAITATRWLRQAIRLQAIRRSAQPVPIPFPVPVLSTAHPMEPGIIGILRPALLLPEGLSARLTAGQLQAILAHELCHVRHRDNATAALHMVINTVFWFHPLLWWIGARLIAERERACDEAVLAAGEAPDAYAQGIVSVCRFYLESPLPCVSGVTGADLKQRIKEIMTQRISSRLTPARKVLLASAAAAAVALPLGLGILRAQTLPPPPAYTYDVVTVRPSAPGQPGQVRRMIGPGPQGGMKTENTSVMSLLTFAYDVREFQFTGGPNWIRTDGFDITFTPDKPEAAPSPGMDRQVMESMFNRQRQRMQAVLRDRFGLVLRADTKEMQVYALVPAKSGPKLTAAEASARGQNMRIGRGQLNANGVTLKMFADSLSSSVGRPVLDETGIKGIYDIKLEWTPEGPAGGPPGAGAAPADAGGPSIFTALTEQLGLRLESKKAPATVFVIEKIEKPSEN